MFSVKTKKTALSWIGGKIELAVGDKVKITAIEGMEYDTIYMSNMTDEDMLGYLSEKQKQQMLTEYLKDFYLLEAQLKKKGVL